MPCRHASTKEACTTATVSRLAALALVVAGIAGCGGGYGGSSSPTAPTSPTTPAAPAASSAITISIMRQNGAQSFSPNPASAGGQQVVFRNADTIVHRVVLNDGSIDTGDIAPGATSRAFTMPAAGTNYHCALHPTMIGAVSAGSGGQVPACEGVYCTDESGNKPGY